MTDACELACGMYARAEERQWISPAMQAFVRAMAEERLHPEQIFIGLGLLTLDQYAEALSEVAGRPFVRVEDLPTLEEPWPLSLALCETERCLPLWHEASMWHIGFVMPPPASAWNAWKKRCWSADQGIEPYVILDQDWRKRMPGTSVFVTPPLHRVTQAWQEAAHASALHQAQVRTHVSHASWTHDGEEKARFELSPAAVGGVSLHLERHAARLGWHIERRPLMQGASFQAVRLEPHPDRPHPFEWLAAVARFLEAPAGLLCLHTADAYARTRLQRMAAGRPEVEYAEVPDADAFERVLHGVLTGSAAIACVRPARAGSWNGSSFDEIQAALCAVLEPADVPYALIRSYDTGAGHSWESL